METKKIKNILLVGAVLLFLITSCKPRQSHGIPEGWIVAGSQPESYKMGTDSSIAKTGNYSAIIQSIDAKIEGFGTLMQQSSAVKFLGKRVKLSGFLKSENVNGWAGLWLRVDVDTVVVSFDNMLDGKTAREIKGTTDWKKYEIVLDVPSNATMLSYGALLSGSGKIWFDNFTFEVVANTVETTGISFPCSTQNAKEKQGLIAEPSNIDFEK